ncbi:hypothetical protein BGV04_19835, partial [Clostridioides difficile]
MDGEAGPGLAHRHDLEAVDVQVGGLVHDPEDGLGDVFRLDRMGSRVGLVVARLVAAEADQGDPAPPQPRPAVGPARPAAPQVATDGKGEGRDESRAAAASVTTRVAAPAGHRRTVAAA